MFFKWLRYVILSLGILVLIVLTFFGWGTSLREVELATEVAPARGRFIDTSDAKVFIQESGSVSGKPIILIHGTGAWSEIWRETINELTKSGFHTIAIDVPPFGYSEKLPNKSSYSREKQAKRIIEILDELNINSAIFVGHSVGGRPTTEVALAYPERVKKLILVDPALGFQVDPNESPHFVQNNPSFLVRTLFSIKPLRKAVLSTYGTNPWFTQKLFASFVSNKTAVTDARVTMLQEPLSVKSTTDAYGDWLQYLVVEKDLSLGSDFSNFKNLSMPVHIIWGSTDTITPLWQGGQLQSLIPHSTLSTIENVGHIPYIEDADQFNRLLLQYLQNK